MHLKMLSAEVICCIHLLTLLTYVSVETNSVDPNQTAPVKLTKKFLTFHWTTKAEKFCCGWRLKGCFIPVNRTDLDEMQHSGVYTSSLSVILILLFQFLNDQIICSSRMFSSKFSNLTLKNI